MNGSRNAPKSGAWLTGTASASAWSVQTTERMVHMILLDMVREYQTLLERKDELAAQTKDNNAAIEDRKVKIAQQMVDDDCPRISSGGYSFSLAQKTIYSKRSEEEIKDSGMAFFDVLREEGLGDIIVEKVDPRTLQATMKSYIEENGELSEALDKVVKGFDTVDITRRKESVKIGGKKS